MAGTLDEALRQLDTALNLLEATLGRRFDVEKSRGDLETELQLMQDDRARLAVELDGATARLHRLEDATQDVGRRVERTIGTIREALARAAPAHEA